MDFEAQLKLQAYLDGELAEADAREVGNLLARDREAVTLMTELRNTRAALRGSEIGIEVPESRDFYWSKIRHEIERLEAPSPAAAPVTAPWLSRLRRLLVPAAAAALLAIVGIVSLNDSAAAYRMETSLSDPGAFTYRDYERRMTLVWFSYPAEENLAPTGEPDSFE